MSDLRPQCILDLPIDMLTLIIRVGNIKLRYTAAQTCKALSTIVRHRIGYGEIRIRSRSALKLLDGNPLLKNTKIILSQMNDLTVSDFKSLANVRDVDASYTPNITDECVAELSNIHAIGLSHSEITDTGVLSLVSNNKRRIHTIDLSATKISDKSLIALQGVHTILLENCESITDTGIKALKGVHTIYLAGAAITDEGLEALKGVKTIDLTCCNNLTSKGLFTLSGVHTVNLRRLPVTDECLKALAGVHTININSCTRVTDEGVKALRGCYSAVLCQTSITDASLIALAGISILYVSGCTAITDVGVRAVGLKGVKVIDLSECSLVTDEGIKTLTKAECIMVNSCGLVTNECIPYLMENCVEFYYDGTQITCEEACKIDRV